MNDTHPIRVRNPEAIKSLYFCPAARPFSSAARGNHREAVDCAPPSPDFNANGSVLGASRRPFRVRLVTLHVFATDRRVDRRLQVDQEPDRIARDRRSEPVLVPLGPLPCLSEQRLKFRFRPSVFDGHAAAAVAVLDAPRRLQLREPRIQQVRIRFACSRNARNAMNSPRSSRRLRSAVRRTARADPARP
ncbi:MULTISPECIES: hypothetical protein [Burkholderia]|uniref:hypothetical protein n=1 Tax=Burkholderia TaxID=32008 RepID=UPI0013630BD1|nr:MULTISPECIES: hypothetical protein [Burkholderia]